MQRLHAAPAHFCGSQRAELFGWLISRHAKRPQQSRATHARKRQAPPVHAAVWKRVFGESHTVRPCRRYGAANCFYLSEDRGRSAAVRRISIQVTASRVVTIGKPFIAIGGQMISQ